MIIPCPAGLFSRIITRIVSGDAQAETETRNLRERRHQDSPHTSNTAILFPEKITFFSFPPLQKPLAVIII